VNFYVAEHPRALWYFIASPLLGAHARAAFDEGSQGQALIYIPPLFLRALFPKREDTASHRLFATFALLTQSATIRSIAIRAIDTLEFERDKAVSDIHDRIMVGVARRVNAMLLSRDEEITGSGVVATVW